MHHQSQHAPQQNGEMTSRVLQVLECLDRHSFDKVDITNNLDSLYAKIFSPVSSLKGTEIFNVEHMTSITKRDEPTVKVIFNLFKIDFQEIVK